MASYTVNSQIRIPIGLYQYIQAESDRMGVSQNAVMLMLMDMGRSLKEAPITRQVEERQGRDLLHTLQQRP